MRAYPTQLGQTAIFQTASFTTIFRLPLFRLPFLTLFSDSRFLKMGVKRSSRITDMARGETSTIPPATGCSPLPHCGARRFYLPSIPGGNVTDFAPPKALKSIACGKLTCGERVVVHRVNSNWASGQKHPWLPIFFFGAECVSSAMQIFFLFFVDLKPRVD